MDSMHQLEIVIILLAAVLALTTVANKILIPYPILLVLGGLILGVLPGLPMVTLSPDLVFLVFLPPILWAAAYFTSLREFRRNLRPISLLAVGLVLVTTAAVAAVAHVVLPGIGWAEAIVLGAIVSPPDAVSATAIGKRLGIPRRVVTILEGESLVNDATALVLYRVAVGAAVTGTFTVGGAILEFIFAAVVGVAIGIAVGVLARWLDPNRHHVAGTVYCLGAGRVCPCLCRVGLCGRRSVPSTVFQQCGCSRHPYSGKGGVGFAHFCPQRRHLYSDRSSTRSAAR